MPCSICSSLHYLGSLAGVIFCRVADALALLFLEEQTGFTTHLVAFIAFMASCGFIGDGSGPPLAALWEALAPWSLALDTIGNLAEAAQKDPTGALATLALAFKGGIKQPPWLGLGRDHIIWCGLCGLHGLHGLHSLAGLHGCHLGVGHGWYCWLW